MIELTTLHITTAADHLAAQQGAVTEIIAIGIAATLATDFYL